MFIISYNKKVKNQPNNISALSYVFHAEFDIFRYFQYFQKCVNMICTLHLSVDF